MGWLEKRWVALEANTSGASGGGHCSQAGKTHSLEARHAA